MLRYFTNDKGKKRAVQVIFEYKKDKTQGVSVHVIDTDKSIEARRKDRLVYKKDSE